MSLIAWYPLNGALKNYGIGDFPDGVNVGSLTTSTSGKIGSTYNWTADGQAVNIVNGMNLLKPLTKYSMMCWAYMTNLGSYNGKLAFISSGDYNNSFMDFGIMDGQIITFPGSGCYSGYTLSSAIPLNTWHHFCITCDGTYTYIYLDGTLQGRVSGGGITQSSETNNFYIGAATYYSGFTHKGNLNDIRIYDHYLSPKEVSEIAKGLILHYPMNEIDGVIGGRNIALKTNQGITGWSWRFSTGGATKTEVVEDDIRCCKFVRNDISSTSWQYIFYSESYTQPTKFKAGGTYSISFEVKSNIDTASFNYIRLMDGSAITDMTNTVTFIKSTVVANQWSKIEAVLKLKDTLPTDVSACGLYMTPNANTGVSYIFRNLKIEEGSVATPWTPAPEDGGAFAFDNIIYDVSGFGNNGTVTAATCPTWSSDCVVGAGSYDFDGTKYIVGATSDKLPTDEITVSWWGYMDNWANYTRAISCTEGGGWNFEPSSDGTMSFPIFSGGTYKYAVSSTPLSSLASGWHMFSGTYDGMTVKLYIDGKLEASTNAYSTKTAISYYNNAVFVGAEAGSSTTIPGEGRFNGKMNDVRIYATALSADAIKELYQTRFSLANNGTLYCTELIEDEYSFGGRNLILNSLKNVTSNAYGFATCSLASKPIANETYTFTVCGRTNDDKTSADGKYLSTYIYTSDWSWGKHIDITSTTDTIKSVTFTAPSYSADKTWYCSSYYYPSKDGSGVAPAGTCTLNWVKLEKGYYATPWSPAPEDYGAVIADGTASIPAMGQNGVLNSGLVEGDEDMMRLFDNQIVLKNIIEN